MGHYFVEIGPRQSRTEEAGQVKDWQSISMNDGYAIWHLPSKLLVTVFVLLWISKTAPVYTGFYARSIKCSFQVQACHHEGLPKVVPVHEKYFIIIWLHTIIR